MAEKAQVEAVKPLVVSDPRRFELPDFDRHPWLLSRLCEAFPEKNERELVHLLRVVLYDNTHLFLCHEVGVSLFTFMRDNIFESPHGQEIFTFMQKGAENYGVVFYEHAAEWAERMGLEYIVVGINSDVPMSSVANKLNKRVFDRPTKYLKLTA